MLPCFSKRFLYSSLTLLSFWMIGGFFLVAFAFEKQNNIFVKLVFDFLTDFILGTQTMMCPRSVYCCHNRPKYSLVSNKKVISLFKVSSRNTKKKRRKMFRVNKKRQQSKVVGIVLVSLLLTLNILHTFF